MQYQASTKLKIENIKPIILETDTYLVLSSGTDFSPLVVVKSCECENLNESIQPMNLNNKNDTVTDHGENSVCDVLLPFPTSLG